MKTRLAIPIVVAALAALALAAARPPVASATSLTMRLRDQVTRQNLRVLQGYVEEWTLDHGGVFPDTADVARGGRLAAGRAWPKNPWTNASMKQGTALGDYDYDRLVAPVESYALRARLSGGRWFALTPTTFPGQLSELRSELKDAITERNVRVLQGYVHEWWLLHASLPTIDQFTATGDVGAAHDYWPPNAWTNAVLASGSALGDFTYTPGSNGAYTLVGHLSTGDYTIDGQAPPLPGSVKPNPTKDHFTESNLHLIERAIEEYANDNEGTFPPGDQVSASGLVGQYETVWPLDPWTATLMTQGSNVGEFTYSTDGSGFSLTAHLSDGTDYTLDTQWYQIRGVRFAASLKNYCARYGVQVLKDYIDEWKAANGSLPAADQLSATGDVGLSHTWWPSNPWTDMPMESGDAGDGGGYYQYVDNGDGTFTISVGQLVIPQRTPSDPVWPPSYPAQ